MRRSIMTAGIVFIAQVVSAASYAADTSAIWCSGMEEPDINGNWNNQGASQQKYLDPGPFTIPGNSVARITGLSRRWNGRGWKRLYCRYYQKFETGYDFAAACHNGGAFSGGADCYGCAGNRAPAGAGGWFWGTLESCYNDLRRLHFYFYYPGQKMDCANPAGSCWGDHVPCMISDSYCNRISAFKAPPMPLPPLMEDNRWYCIEMMCDAGDPAASATGANGVLDFWIDGTEYGPFQNLWFRSDSIVLVNLIGFMMYYHNGNPNGKTILIDDVVVSGSPVGCGKRVDSSLNLVPVASVIKRSHGRGYPRQATEIDGQEPGNAALIYDIRGRIAPGAGGDGFPRGIYFVKNENTNGFVTIVR